MLVLLVGPKGSGKTHIGRLLEARFGVHFLHVEPLWMAYHAECEAAGRAPVIAEGMTRVHPAVAAALRRHAHVCVETTGASREILDGLLALGAPAGLLVVRVRAPLDVCLARIGARDPRHQIPMDDASLREVHALSEAAAVPADLALDNVDLSDAEILARFEERLGGAA